MKAMLLMRKTMMSDAIMRDTIEGLAEIVWLMFIAACLLITAPVWLVPYTLFKIWKSLRRNT